MKGIRIAICWLLCLVMLAGATSCTGEKSASGQNVAAPKVQQEKPAVSAGMHREKRCSAVNFAMERVVVENNALVSVLAAAEANKKGTIEKYQKDKRAEIEKVCSGETPISCQTMIAAMGSALAWPLLPEAAGSTSLIGAGANAGIGYLINSEVNPNDVIFAYWTGALTAGTGLWGTIGVNASSGAASSYLKGDDPLKGGALSGAASGLGYGVGKLAQGQFDKVLNPNWKNWTWVDMGMGISKPMPLDPLPGISGNIIGSGATEFTNDQVGKKLDEIGSKK